MDNKESVIVFGHDTTWHDGNVSIYTPSKREIVSLASERVDRIKHGGNSKVVYEYLRKRFSAYKFRTKSDYFTDISKGLKKEGHHLNHAASTFFGSPFERVAILVIDGQGPDFGKLASTTIWKGEGNKLELVEAPYLAAGKFAPKSVGHFYSAISALSGMLNLNEEGKTMGLAAYGKESEILDYMRKFAYSNTDGTYFIDPNFIYAVFGNTYGPRSYGWKKQPKKIQKIWKDIIKVRGRPLRSAGEDVTEEDMNFAFAGQTILEEIVLGLAKRAKNLTGLENLCLAGGVALNAIANGKIKESKIFKDIFIFPASGDDGQSIGKLFYHLHKNNIDLETTCKNAFYGPEYNEGEIIETLQGHEDNLVYSKFNEIDLVNEVTDRIIDGQVLGVWRGRSEIGPRALGHRSIIADPRKEEMREFINSQVKNREWYRPLAPVVLEEKVEDYFEIDTNSPFMLLAIKVKQDKRNQIPAVTHVDGSARLQTISETQERFFYNLVKDFGNKTGIPVLLNTSFNEEREPIVEHPSDAIKSFMRMNLDALLLENYLVTKRKT